MAAQGALDAEYEAMEVLQAKLNDEAASAAARQGSLDVPSKSKDAAKELELKNLRARLQDLETQNLGTQAQTLAFNQAKRKVQELNAEVQQLRKLLGQDAKSGGASTSGEAGSKAKAEAPKGFWASIVSPFLTESDMRDLASTDDSLD